MSILYEIFNLTKDQKQTLLFLALFLGLISGVKFIQVGSYEVIKNSKHTITLNGQLEEIKSYSVRRKKHSREYNTYYYAVYSYNVNDKKQSIRTDGDYETSSFPSTADIYYNKIFKCSRMKRPDNWSFDELSGFIALDVIVLSGLTASFVRENRKKRLYT